ncbi:MAG: hypothetical protein GY909_15135 [Oligoflexia bacterium]|nr:hypothetical protein [Oligoflexia bacterium]
MQEMKVLILSSYELIMSMIFAMITIYLATKFMNKFVLSKPVEWFIKEKHAPGCLISGTLICSVLYLVQGSIQNSVLALQSLLIANNQFTLKILGIALAYFVVFYIVTFLTSFIVIYVISEIYRKMMEGINFDEEVQIKRNMGISIFLSLICLGATLFMDGALNNFLGSLVFHEYLQKL